MKLYVGNLSWGTSEEDLESLFGKVGSVQSAVVVTDRETGRSRGFGFVEMSDADAAKAISEFNGADHDGRKLRVNEANERPQRRSGGGGGDRGDRGDRGGRW